MANGSASGTTANRYIEWAQTFQPLSEGILNTITIRGNGTTVPDIVPPPAEVTFKLYDVLAPNTVLELGSTTLSTPGLTSDISDISASFLSQDILLDAGHTYAFGVPYPTANNELLFIQVSSPGYSGGELSQIFGSSIFPQGSGGSLTFFVTAASGPSAVPDVGSSGLLVAVAFAGVLFCRKPFSLDRH